MLGSIRQASEWIPMRPIALCATPAWMPIWTARWCPCRGDRTLRDNALCNAFFYADGGMRAQTEKPGLLPARRENEGPWMRWPPPNAQWMGQCPVLSGTALCAQLYT